MEEGKRILYELGYSLRREKDALVFFRDNLCQFTITIDRTGYRKRDWAGPVPMTHREIEAAQAVLRDLMGEDAERVVLK